MTTTYDFDTGAVCDAIAGGEADNDLDQLERAVAARKQLLVRRTLDALHPGCLGTLSHPNLSPRYMIGCPVKYIGPGGKGKVEVEIDQDRNPDPHAVDRWGHGPFRVGVDVFKPDA